MKLTIKTPEGNIEKIVEVDMSRSLLKQLEDAGVQMHSACHAGICGACICNIESGGENLDKSFLSEPGFPLADDEIMTCIGGICNDSGEVVLKKIYS